MDEAVTLHHRLTLDMDFIRQFGIRQNNSTFRFSIQLLSLFDMDEGEDKREHSTKPEVDDLTDYQSLNSLEGAGVAGEAKETQASSGSEQVATASEESETPAELESGDDYNDGADFITVDNKGQTNI